MTDPRLVLTAHLISTGPEDDAAFESLHDIATAFGGGTGACVVGGHMVAVLTAAHPTPGLIERRTGDTDAGIPVSLAASGEPHRALTAAGYVARSGNRYTKPGRDPEPTIDLLTPSLTGRFETHEHGGRGFDAAPGLEVALQNTVDVEIYAHPQTGTELHFQVTVPTVEAAVILKAHAWRNRFAVKDAIDLYNLLLTFDHHGPEVTGRWRLGEAGLIGSRADAARRLHLLADRAETGNLRRSPVDPRKLVVMIRRHVTNPDRPVS